MLCRMTSNFGTQKFQNFVMMDNEVIFGAVRQRILDEFPDVSPRQKRFHAYRMLAAHLGYVPQKPLPPELQ